MSEAALEPAKSTSRTSVSRNGSTARPPKLALACCDGKHFDDATLVVRKAGEKPVEYIKIKMEEVLITSISTGGSGGEDRLTENVTLNFAKVSLGLCSPGRKRRCRERPFPWLGISRRTLTMVSRVPH